MKGHPILFGLGAVLTIGSFAISPEAASMYLSGFGLATMLTLWLTE